MLLVSINAYSNIFLYFVKQTNSTLLLFSSIVTHNYDFGKCSPEEVKENLMSGNYDNYDYFKGYSQVRCSNCEDVIIDLG